MLTRSVSLRYVRCVGFDRVLNLILPATTPLEQPKSLRYDLPQVMDSPNPLPYGKATPQSRRESHAWSFPMSVGKAVALPWQSTLAREIQLGMAWSSAVISSRGWPFPWEDPGIGNAPIRILWDRLGESRFQMALSGGLASQCRGDYGLTWGGYTQEIPTVTLLIPTGYSNQPNPISHHGVHLRIYTMKNEALIQRVSDGLTLPATSVTLSTDIDSFCWQFSISLVSEKARQFCQPGEAIRIQVNGFEWAGFLEGYRYEESFNHLGVSLKGRSYSSLLAAPYQPEQSRIWGSAANASQVVEALLPSDWQLLWKPELNWQIPAGLFSYQNKTPMQVIAMIAEAFGGVAYGDRASKKMIVDHRYPVSPWNFATLAEVTTLPESMILSRSVDYQPQPGYNAVVVSGESQGVVVNAIRSGTPGDCMAPQIVDKLITQVEVGRERARRVMISQGYDQQAMALELPLFPAQSGYGVSMLNLLDVVKVGALYGLVQSVNISASRQSGSLSVRQSLQIDNWII